MSESTVKKFPTIKKSLAPKPRPHDQHPTNSSQLDDPPALAAVPSTPPAPKPRPKPAQRPHAPQEQRGSRSLSFLIPDDLRTALKARATRDQQSLPNVLLDAIEATHHEIGHEIRAEEPAQQSTGLFQRPRRREATENQSTMVIRVPEQAFQTIDELWRTAEADNRSQYIRAALRKYLTPTIS